MRNTLTRLTAPPFPLFVVLGLLITLAIFELTSRWIPILAVVYGKPNLGYHDLPAYAHYIQWTLRWAVWLILPAIIALDAYKRKFNRSFGYVIGMIFAMMAWILLFFIRYTVTMSKFD